MTDSTPKTEPVRLQRRRVKGFHLESPNGLPVVMVTRPGKWGNPYRVGSPGVSTKEQSVAMFRRAIEQLAPGDVLSDGRLSHDINMEIIRAELAGKNLACYCKPGDACHADVLLQLANQRTPHAKP